MDDSCLSFCLDGSASEMSTHFRVEIVYIFVLTWDSLNIKSLSSYWTPCMNSPLQRHYKIITMKYASLSINSKYNFLRTTKGPYFYIHTPNLISQLHYKNINNSSVQRQKTVSEGLCNQIVSFFQCGRLLQSKIF